MRRGGRPEQPSPGTQEHEEQASKPHLATNEKKTPRLDKCMHAYKEVLAPMVVWDI